MLYSDTMVCKPFARVGKILALIPDVMLGATGIRAARADIEVKGGSRCKVGIDLRGRKLSE